MLICSAWHPLLLFQESADGTDVTKAENFRKILRRASSLPTDVVDGPAASASSVVADQPTYADAAVATDPVPGTTVCSDCTAVVGFYRQKPVSDRHRV